MRIDIFIIIEISMELLLKLHTADADATGLPGLVGSPVSI